VLARLSLRTRVSLLAAVAVGLAIACSAVAAYATVRHELLANTDSNLLRRAKAAAASPLAESGTLTSIPSSFFGAADIRLALIDSDGHAVSAAGEASAPPLGAPEIAVAAGTKQVSIRTTAAGGTTYRVVAVPVRNGSSLVLAQSMGDLNSALNQLGIVLMIVGIGGIAVAATAGLAIARAGLRPVQRLQAATEYISRTRDLRPIPVNGTDELAGLTTSFNEMLAVLDQTVNALEVSRERQRQLAADAGHELRTPLTSLRTNLDLLAMSTRSTDRTLDPAERDALLEDVRAQTEELSALVADLVQLSRDDAPVDAGEPVDLAAVVHRAVERARRRAPRMAFTVDTAPWVLAGDPDGLERAVMNLLDNAITWSPPHGPVEVRLHDGVLEVADHGSGIPNADLPNIFQRFYRAPDARPLPGSGLGLAIVAHVVEQHGGQVTAANSARGGAVLTIRLPGHISESLRQAEDSKVS